MVIELGRDFFDPRHDRGQGSEQELKRNILLADIRLELDFDIMIDGTDIVHRLKLDLSEETKQEKDLAKVMREVYLAHLGYDKGLHLCDVRYSTSTARSPRNFHKPLKHLIGSSMLESLVDIEGNRIEDPKTARSLYVQLMSGMLDPASPITDKGRAEIILSGELDNYVMAADMLLEKRFSKRRLTADMGDIARAANAVVERCQQAVENNLFVMDASVDGLDYFFDMPAESLSLVSFRPYYHTYNSGAQEFRQWAEKIQKYA